MTWSGLILSATLAVAPVQAPEAQAVVSEQEITNQGQLLSSNLEELSVRSNHFGQNSRFKQRQLLKNGHNLSTLWVGDQNFEHSDQNSMNSGNQSSLGRFFKESTFSSHFDCRGNGLPSLLPITDMEANSILQAGLCFIEFGYLRSCNQERVQRQLVFELADLANFLGNYNSKHQISDQSSGQFWNDCNRIYSQTRKLGIEVHSKETSNLSRSGFEFFQNRNLLTNFDSLTSVTAHLSDTGSSIGFFTGVFIGVFIGNFSENFFRDFFGNSIGVFNEFLNRGASYTDNSQKRLLGVSVIFNAFKLSLPVQFLELYSKAVNLGRCALFSGNVVINIEPFQLPIGYNDCHNHKLIITESA